MSIALKNSIVALEQRCQRLEERLALAEAALRAQAVPQPPPRPQQKRA